MSKRAQGWLAGLALVAAAGWLALERERQTARRRALNHGIRVLVSGEGGLARKLAARLAEAGVSVTWLVTSARLGELSRQALAERWHGFVDLQVLAALAPAFDADLALLCLEGSPGPQTAGCLDTLSPGTPALALLAAESSASLHEASLADGRALLGLVESKGFIRVGETSGADSVRLHQALVILARAGFSVRAERSLLARLSTSPCSAGDAHGVHLPAH